MSAMPVPPSEAVSQPALLSLPPLNAEALRATLQNAATAFVGKSLLVATPDALPDPAVTDVQVITYTPIAQQHSLWVPTAADYLDTWTIARQQNARAIVLLGADSASVSPATMALMADTVASGHDLALPRYPVGPHDALVNSAILYPLTRALFSHRVRFPLPIDVALSRRMAERLAMAAQRLTAAGQGDALLWPVAEASVAGYLVREVQGEPRHIPHPDADSLNTILNTVAGSLFADIEAKAAFWQRARLTPPSSPAESKLRVTDGEVYANPVELTPMIEVFRNAYVNLRELWSLVLPPHSLLGLQRLSQMPVETFLLPDALWARTVYDFLLAFRLRTINRGHLLGALTPLYLAWVASHLRHTGGDAARAEQHIESTAEAFENDKPYLVAGWRWPDRFNP